jgi:peptidoglycan/LPS O-acetylase OafA/YrhL
VESDENSSAEQLRKLKTQSKWNHILVACAFLGSVSVFIINGVLQSMGFGFPLSYLRITRALGALFGIIVAFIVRKHSGSRLAMLAIASFVGLILPCCLLQMLFLIFGPLDP